MQILSTNNVNGDFVNLKLTNPRHIAGVSGSNQPKEPVVSSFADMFNKALNEVNELEVTSKNLATQMAIDPDSVDIHTVQIAAEEAEVAVLFTKGIFDRVIRAYKEITNLR
jgi:flagellar hook-basal body complex protein FliE